MPNLEQKRWLSSEGKYLKVIATPSAKEYWLSDLSSTFYFFLTRQSKWSNRSGDIKVNLERKIKRNLYLLAFHQSNRQLNFINSQTKYYLTNSIFNWRTLADKQIWSIIHTLICIIIYNIYNICIVIYNKYSANIANIIYIMCIYIYMDR